MHLQKIWNQSQKRKSNYSTITKLHQDVFETLTEIQKDQNMAGFADIQNMPRSQKMKGLDRMEMVFNKLTPNIFYEVDILINTYAGVQLERPIAVEVNGVYHYARNSEEILGKDQFKIDLLEGLEGYQVLSIPYYDWYVLENDQKKSYIDLCIKHLCDLK